MEVEITNSPQLTRQQAALLDMHSAVNILNVLLNELGYLREVLRNGEQLQPAVDAVQRIHLRFHDTDEPRAEIGSLLECEDRVMQVVRAALDAGRDAADDPEVRESVANLRSVFAVLDTRARELLDRAETPDIWKDHDVGQLTQNFTRVLAAIEKNSKGRYRIVRNIAEQEERDYMVNFSIQSVDGDTIRMPPVLQDVMRDLIANARKYTDPGGEITAGLVDNRKALRLVVEDTGHGIPPDEIQRVVEFGKRGSSVEEKAKMGGGFGLTKAYLVTRRFGGRMWIDSREGTGTRITINVPRPAP